MGGRFLQDLPDLSALSALTDLSAGGNKLRGPEALGALPPSLTKLMLRDNRLGEVPFALLSGLPALQARSLYITALIIVCTSCEKIISAYRRGLVPINGGRRKVVEKIIPCLLSSIAIVLHFT